MFLGRYKDVYPFADSARSTPAHGMCDTEIVEISTGEMKIGEGRAVLNSGGLGSCIAVVAFDHVNRRGGIAHIMLPGRCLHDHEPKCYRYAENGISALFNSLQQQGTCLENLHICIAGAANVLQRADDTICAGNIISVRNTLGAFGVSIRAESLGGVIRRRVRLHLPMGHVECAIGDNPAFCLWGYSDDQQ